MKTTIIAALAVLALLAGACAQEQEQVTGEEQGPTPAPTQEALLTDKEKPEVEVPEGDPPTELVIEDIEEGDGDEATAGSNVSVHYVGVAYSTEEEFDASWDRGQPFTFELGAGMVIQGWDEGVEGMRVGGRRKLVIPPDLAYGERSPGPGIGPNETLVFVVDLLEVQAPATQTTPATPGP